jgi:hypothetical protein
LAQARRTSISAKVPCNTKTSNVTKSIGRPPSTTSLVAVTNVAIYELLWGQIDEFNGAMFSFELKLLLLICIFVLISAIFFQSSMSEFIEPSVFIVKFVFNLATAAVAVPFVHISVVKGLY